VQQREPAAFRRQTQWTVRATCRRPTQRIGPASPRHQPQVEALASRRHQTRGMEPPAFPGQTQGMGLATCSESLTSLDCPPLSFNPLSVIRTRPRR
jgi:hypothetical protein